MPIEKSFMVDEPSVGPSPAQTLVKPTSSMTRSEIAAESQFKVIAVDPIILALGATTANQTVFIADDNYQVQSVRAVAETLGGASAAVTVERLTGTTANGSGVAQLSAAIDLAANIHVVKTGSLKAGGGDTLAIGDRLGIVMSGTLTALVGLIVIVLKRV